MSAAAAATARELRPGRVLAAAMMGVVLVTLDVSAVNVAAPALGASFHVGLGGMAWVLNIYTLAYAAFLLNAGALNDRHGPAATFLCGFALFTGASLGCGLAPGYGWLLAARLLQGLGAALLVPSAMTLLQLAFPDPAARARAIGWWAGAGSFALAGGPVLGGALIASFGWRSVFLLNLPVGAAGLWLTRAHAPAARPRPAGRTDVAGLVLGAVALGALTLAVTEAGELGWSSPWVGGGLLAALAAGAAFVAVERRSLHPMAPPDAFGDAVFSAAVASGFAINFAFYGLVFVLSVFFQRVQGRSPLGAGLAFAPLTVVLMAVNLAAGRLNAGLGLRRTLVAGLGVAAIGYLGLLPATAASPLTALAPALLLVGVGVAAATPAMMGAALSGVGPERAGVGSGLVNAARQVGGSLGVAIFGALVAGRGGFTPGFRTVLALSAAVLLAAAAAVVVYVPADAARRLPRR